MDCATLMETRRSVNFFDPKKEVSEKELREMVRLAAFSPSSFNLQPWNLMVVRSAADRARLRKQAMDQAKVTEAPVVLIVLADLDGYKEGNPAFEKDWEGMLANGYMKAEQRGWLIGAAARLYGTDARRSLAFAVKNAGLFTMSLMLAAKELGLDTHPMDGFDHDGVMKEFAIPDNFFVPMLICVGHFDQSKKLLPRNWRKSYEEIVRQTL